MRTGFVKDSLSEDLRRETGLWMRTFVEIGVSNGRGLSEIVGLRVEQVDFEANATGREPGTTKNKEGREVLLAPCAPVGQCCHGNNRRIDCSPVTTAVT